MLACGTTSARTDILARYGKFSMGLRTSVCKEVRVLFNLVAKDLQSTTIRSIRLVRESSGLDPWTVGPGKLKETLDTNEMPFNLRTLGRLSTPGPCSGSYRSRMTVSTTFRA